MRKRIVRSALALGLVTTLGLAGWVGISSAHAAHRDLLINRAKTEFTSGPFTGDTVTFYGSGSWNTATGAIDAKGVLVHRHGNHVIARAVWVGTGVQSFTSFGSSGPLEGGTLVLDVKFFPPGGAPFTVSDFTVTCLVGSPTQGAEEGVDVQSLGLTDKVEGPHRFTLFFQI